MKIFTNSSVRVPLFACVMLLFTSITAPPAHAELTATSLSDFTTAWRNHPIWYDGKAEYATYTATRKIYGQPRAYDARIIINKEHYDPKFATKSASSKGTPVFKLHLRDAPPTPNYTYRFSTMAYLGVHDLHAQKLEIGSQEDCGTTFKSFVTNANTGKMRWFQSSYFPNEGIRHKTDITAPPANLFAFTESLPLILRGYPFDADLKSPLTLMLLPVQKTTHLTPTKPKPHTVTYLDKQTLDLPIGTVQAHHLRIRDAASPNTPPIDLWFDASPDRQHIMVKYENPTFGETYELKSVKRWAYWK